MKLLLWMIPLPYVANQLGWTLSELGRQPWIVYGICAPGTRSPTWPSSRWPRLLVAFFLVYGLLGVTDFYLSSNIARKGPASAAMSAEEADMFETIWFIIWGVAWAVYFMLDGFDLGLGTLLPFLARSETERRVWLTPWGRSGTATRSG